MAIRVPSKLLTNVEHYVGGILVSGGGLALLEAFQKNHNWKDVLWAFAVAFLAPLQHQIGVAKFISSLFVKTGVTQGQADLLAQAVLDKGAQEINQKATENQGTGITTFGNADTSTLDGIAKASGETPPAPTSTTPSN